MEWLNYFQRNRDRWVQIDPQDQVSLSEELRKPLLRSLQKFQVGESGEGNHLKAGARKTGDPLYARTIDLFIAEEQEHSRLLAEIIALLGGELVDSHWSDSAFILLRRLMGLRLELMVLLIAEMIAKRYYRALDEGTDARPLNRAFRRIRDDEEGHIAFHLETLNRSFGRWPWVARATVYSIWQWMFRVVCLLVALDHRPVLTATGVSLREFWKDCNSIFEDAAWRAFQPAVSPDDMLAFPFPEGATKG